MSQAAGYSAAQSAAGYLYQARLALTEALRYAYADSSIELAIERFDDVSFEREGSAVELLQTKHHLKKSGDLTDSGADLLKTLRIWAEGTKADPSLPGRTRFTRVTTPQARQGSAASYLRRLMRAVAIRPRRKPCVWRRALLPKTKLSRRPWLLLLV